MSVSPRSSAAPLSINAPQQTLTTLSSAPQDERHSCELRGETLAPSADSFEPVSGFSRQHRPEILQPRLMPMCLLAKSEPIVFIFSHRLCLFFPDSYPYVSSLVCAFFMFLTPLWIVISSRHPASRTLLYSGWEPVITAMVISRCVCITVCVCVYLSVEKPAPGCPQPPLSGMLDDSSPPKHMHLQLPLSPAALGKRSRHARID